MKDPVKLGRIIKPHGIKGDVVIRVFCASPLDLSRYPTLFDAQQIAYKLQNFRLGTASDTVIAHIPGCTTRNQAEALRDLDLYVERNQLPPTEDEDTFYIHDLIGSIVLDAITNETCGKLTYVHDFGAGAILEIKTPQGALKHIPFRPEAVLSLDLEQKQIKINQAFLM